MPVAINADLSPELNAIMIQSILPYMDMARAAYKPSPALSLLTGDNESKDKDMLMEMIKQDSDTGTLISGQIVKRTLEDTVFGRANGGERRFTKNEILRETSWHWGKYEQNPILTWDVLRYSKSNPARVKLMVLHATNYKRGFSKFLALSIYTARNGDPQQIPSTLANQSNRIDASMKAINSIPYLLDGSASNSCGGVIPSSLGAFDYIWRPFNDTDPDLSGDALGFMLARLREDGEYPPYFLMPKEAFGELRRSAQTMVRADMAGSKDLRLAQFDTIDIAGVTCIADPFNEVDASDPNNYVANIYGINPEYMLFRTPPDTDKGFITVEWERLQNSWNYAMGYLWDGQIIIEGSRRFMSISTKTFPK